MDMNKLSTGDKVMGISAILLVIISFFPWFGKDYSGFGVSSSYSESGFSQFPFGMLAVLLAIVVIVMIVLRAFTDVDLPDKVGNLGWGQLFLIATAIVVGLVLLLMAIGKKKYGITLDRKPFGFIGVLAAVGLVVGGFMKWKEDEASASGGSAPPAPPAPPIA